MSKAILVVDMPESCDMCNFAEMVNGKMYCIVPGCGKLAEDYIVCRPDWCPFRELPEKKDSMNLNTIMENCKDRDSIMDSVLKQFIVDGYNACIDEILRGAE